MPAVSALGKARSVTTTWTAVTAQMSKDAVSIKPETRLQYQKFVSDVFYDLDFILPTRLN